MRLWDGQRFVDGSPWGKQTPPKWIAAGYPLCKCSPAGSLRLQYVSPCRQVVPVWWLCRQKRQKCAKSLQVQMQTRIIHSVHPSCSISFLSAFKLPCDTRGVHKRATSWFLHIFIECPAAAALNACMALRAPSHKLEKEGASTPYCEAVNNFLQTYAMYDVIVETDANMIRFRQPLSVSPTKYV